MHASAPRPIKWHCEEDEDSQPLAQYNARRRRNVAGEGARQAIGGDGYRLENRSKFIPFEPQNPYEDTKYWRKQERDETGRTLIARTLENAFMKEYVRSSTPEKGKMYSKQQMFRNVKRIREESEANRWNRGNSLPLSDDDLLRMGEQIFPPSKAGTVLQWLNTATKAEKEEYRQMMTSIMNCSRRHRYARAPISDDKQRPQTSDSRPRQNPRRSSAMSASFGDWDKLDPMKIFGKIKEKLDYGFGDMKKSFKYFDRAGTRKLTAMRFTEVLGGFGIFLSKHEKDAVFGLCESEDGQIRYDTFLSMVVPDHVQADGKQRSLALSGPVHALAQLGAHVGEEMSMDELIELLRTKAAQRSGGSGLRAAFRHMDKDKSGKVESAEMQEVLASFNIFVRQEQVEELVRLFDPDGSGAIDFFEFVKKVLPPDYDEEVQGAVMFGRGRPSTSQRDNPRRPRVEHGDVQDKYYMPSKMKVNAGLGLDNATVVEGLRQQLRDYHFQRHHTMNKAFKAILGGRQEPKISFFAFVRHLKDVMISASPQEARALFERLDVDQDGWLDHADLVHSLGLYVNDVGQKQAAQRQFLSTMPSRRPASSAAPPRPHSSADSLPPPRHGGGGRQAGSEGAGAERGGEAAGLAGQGAASRPKTADLFLMAPPASVSTLSRSLSRGRQRAALPPQGDSAR